MPASAKEIMQRVTIENSMILVTGATGKTGRALVKELVTMGRRVRALVRDPTRAADLAAQGVELVVGDLGEPATLPAALAGIRSAYLMSTADPRQVMLHSNFIRAADRAAVSHIVRHSVRGADSDSPVKLARWHAASEQELERSGMQWTHLQPVYNMQNFFRFAPAIQSQGAFSAPMNDAALSMVDVRDIAAVAAAALSGNGHAGKRYVITGPAPLTFIEAAAQLTQTLHKPVRYVNLRPEDARVAFLRAGMPQWYVDDLLRLYDFYGSNAGAVVTDVVQRTTGRPGRTFLEFARDHRSLFDEPFPVSPELPVSRVSEMTNVRP
jgi:uncharacterized protein YbjT (DUF2867 family)